MDLTKALRELHLEKQRIDRAIVSLEELARDTRTAPIPEALGERRGRKSMGEAERRDVSARMKKYWASRRRSGRDREHQ
jgi:hypothetical protein